MTMETQETGLQLKVYQAKAKLPRHYMSLIIHFYPEVEEDKSLQDKIRNIMLGRVSDQLWVSRISHVAENYKKAI